MNHMGATVRHSLGWGDGRICPHKRFGRKDPAWPSKGFHNSEGPRSELARHNRGREGRR